MAIFDRILDKYIGKTVDVVVMILLSFLVVDVFMNICFRYLLSLPLSWSDEIATILLVWLTFLGASSAIRRDRHLKIDDFLKKLDEQKRRLTFRIINIFVSIFLLVLIWKGFSLSLASEVKDQITDALQISNAVYYIPLPIGGLLMLPYSIRNIMYGNVRREAP